MRYSSKHLRSRLALASETLRILSSPQLGHVRGAITGTYSYCPPLGTDSHDPDGPDRPISATKLCTGSDP
jgi:hypothetical protein